MLGPTADASRTDEERPADDVSGELVALIPIAARLRIRIAGLERASLVAAERERHTAVDVLLPRMIVSTCRPLLSLNGAPLLESLDDKINVALGSSE
jgi:hypothetical protein